MVTKPANVLAIVPARGGSKGIPRKNIRSFAGYPLVAYSIVAGLRAETVTRVIVSTDDEEIADVARRFGADVPFLRPAELAQDNSLDLPLFQHALTWLAEHEDYHPEVVVQLRPTSPIRPRTCVDDAVKLLLSHPEADSVRGVVPAGQNPHKMWRIDTVSGQMHNLLTVEGVKEPYNAPRQILPQIYWQTGHIDAIRPATILKKNTMSGDVILPVMIDPRYTVDIDNPSDWAKAEWLLLNGGLDAVDPASRRRGLPKDVRLIVLDFDGVLTDNRVWVDEHGHEQVAANRSDSLAMRILRQKTPIEIVVLSMESNPVVAARCKKIEVPVIQGVSEKATVLKKLIADRGLDPSQVVYVGNDVNDLVCFDLVGCACAPADSHPDVLRAADLVLPGDGGRGAVRDLCNMILARQ
ncbi:MAG TPA: acylneuraminate cytidylyltransferase [Longilinea sp.]|nr:acylneuraminate cytidylyltransferase [Longilinea sp.]